MKQYNKDFPYMYGKKWFMKYNTNKKLHPTYYWNIQQIQQSHQCQISEANT